MFSFSKTNKQGVTPSSQAPIGSSFLSTTSQSSFSFHSPRSRDYPSCFPTAMAMHVFFTTRQPGLSCFEAAAPSPIISARHFSLQRTNLYKSPWQIACVRAEDQTGTWRGECRELRFKIQDLREALADVWMQDQEPLLELEKLVLALASVLDARIPAEVGNLGRNVELVSSEAHDLEPSVKYSAIGRNEDEASGTVNLELQGAVQHYKKDIITQSLESQSEDLPKQEGLSTLRRLKHLDVHDYVHNALRTSYLRSWLQTRGIAE